MKKYISAIFTALLIATSLSACAVQVSQTCTVVGMTRSVPPTLIYRCV